MDISGYYVLAEGVLRDSLGLPPVGDSFVNSWAVSEPVTAVYVGGCHIFRAARGDDAVGSPSTDKVWVYKGEIFENERGGEVSFWVVSSDRACIVEVVYPTHVSMDVGDYSILRPLCSEEVSGDVEIYRIYTIIRNYLWRDEKVSEWDQILLTYQCEFL